MLAKPDEGFCSNAQKRLEQVYMLKLGRKRCGDFRDPGKYSESLSTPFGSDTREKHIPGYNYCGPGTAVEQRVRRGDYGINELDNACREHDVDYMLCADDKKALMEADAKLRIAAKKVEDMLERKKSGSTLGNIVQFITTGFTTPKDLNVLHRMAAKTVKNVFAAKGAFERFGLIDPVKFASGLSRGSTTARDIEIAKDLYNNYIDN